LHQNGFQKLSDQRAEDDQKVEDGDLSDPGPGVGGEIALEGRRKAARSGCEVTVDGDLGQQGTEDLKDGVQEQEEK
jgi:hypothetical protein